MPANCCVPNCTKKLYRTENGKKISYFKFPDDLNLKKRWLHAICRDEGKEFTVNQNTKISPVTLNLMTLPSLSEAIVFMSGKGSCRHVFLGHKVLH